MANRPWTNDATLTVALWLANSVTFNAEDASDDIAQTTKEIQALTLMQRNTVTKLAALIADAVYMVVVRADAERNMSSPPTNPDADLSTVDYLQIATRLVEDLDHDTQGGN
jgi:hypothetical protein